MDHDGVVTGVAVTHRRATLDEIGAAGGDGIRATLDEVSRHESVREAFALHTCNRAEAYVVTDRPAEGHEALASFAPDVRDGAVDRLGHEESLQHLLRVAAGLESQVLGEDEILGQMRDALAAAEATGTLGPTLESAVRKALHVGERARTETSINEGTTSLARAAVEAARTETTLAGATALVVGAGETGRTAAQALVDAGVGSLVVANRTVERAEDLAADADGAATAVPLADAADRVADAGVVVTATGSADPVFDREALASAGETVVVDLAVPRDVDPAARSEPGVVVRDVDALRSVTERTRERREAAAEAVAAMVDDEFERLLRSYKRQRADEAVGAMYEGAERMKRAELGRLRSRLAEGDGDLTDDQHEAIEAFADSLVNSLLAPPTRSLKAAAEADDWTTIQTAMALFDPTVEQPEVDDGGGPADAEASAED
ncbi:MAG: glutamyl-tRNA reductase [uncultured archaeon A07HB70]|nr:MAG: glutamyl-tRNA reductase [uncultured archaeon A07HB70]